VDTPAIPVIQSVQFHITNTSQTAQATGDAYRRATKTVFTL
jgi:hypothetical protein